MLPPQRPFVLDSADSEFVDAVPVFAADESSQFADRDESPTSAALIASEARYLLLKYQGDLYADDSSGAPVFAQGGRPSAFHDSWGLFLDEKSPSSGIALPDEFVASFRALDNEHVERAIPRGVKRAFAFTDQDELAFFSEKVLSPDTVAFANSLKDPSVASPLKSREYAQADRAWAIVAEASIVAARCAAYATALADLLAQADTLEVEEDDRRAIRDLLVRISARSFSESLRTQLRVTHFRRLAAVKALNLPPDFNSSAVTRVPREGPYVFGGQFLSAVDSDISMTTRAREVARRVKPRLPSFRRAAGRGGPLLRPVPFAAGPVAVSRAAPPRAVEGPPDQPRPPQPRPLPPPTRLEDDCRRELADPCPPPVGGRLSLFLRAWEQVTQDAFILSVVSLGFKISLLPNFPGVVRQATVAPSDRYALAAIEAEISDLILKKAVVQVDDFETLCLSPIFVIPKSSGDLRVILNLKLINLFIPPQRFRMETLSVILPQLSPQDWAATIDLKDAYLHVPVHQDSRRLLGFSFLGRTYLYQVLPFGLKDSPWVFTRLVATVIAHLRTQGVRIFYYLDDWLVVAGSPALLSAHLELTLEVTQKLGFLIN